MKFTFVKLVNEEELALDVFYEETGSVGKTIRCPSNTLFLTDKKSLFIYLDEDGDGLIYLPKDKEWIEIELELVLIPEEGESMYMNKPDDPLISVNYIGRQYYVLLGD